MQVQNKSYHSLDHVSSYVWLLLCILLDLVPSIILQFLDPNICKKITHHPACTTQIKNVHFQFYLGTILVCISVLSSIACITSLDFN